MIRRFNMWCKRETIAFGSFEYSSPNESSCFRRSFMLSLILTQPNSWSNLFVDGSIIFCVVTK